jgi:Transglycosylase-like domain
MGIAARPTRRRVVTRTGRTPTRDDRRASRAGGRLKLGTSAGFLVVALAIFAATPAHAQQGPGGGDQGVAAAQARADQAASAYIDALFKSQELDGQIAGIQDSMARLEERVATLRDTAQVHALAAYKRSGTPVVALLTSDAPAMDSARRTVLLDYLNARDDDAAAQLRKAREGLQSQQRDLQAAQQQQNDVVTQLKGEEDRLKAELNAAQDQRRRAAGTAAPAGGGLSLSNYVPQPGENPHHNDPFLVCTRGIESKGNYQAYNPSGPYYGAYQFTQSTWDSTANHAGRGELVGVDPRNASEYDQDDMAWTLYQWKGKGPWNGRC